MADAKDLHAGDPAGLAHAPNKPGTQEVNLPGGYPQQGLPADKLSLEAKKAYEEVPPQGSAPGLEDVLRSMVSLLQDIKQAVSSGGAHEEAAYEDAPPAGPKEEEEEEDEDEVVAKQLRSFIQEEVKKFIGPAGSYQAGYNRPPSLFEKPTQVDTEGLVGAPPGYVGNIAKMIGDAVQTEVKKALADLPVSVSRTNAPQPVPDGNAPVVATTTTNLGIPNNMPNYRNLVDLVNKQASGNDWSNLHELADKFAPRGPTL